MVLLVQMAVLVTMVIAMVSAAEQMRLLWIIIWAGLAVILAVWMVCLIALLPWESDGEGYGEE